MPSRAAQSGRTRTVNEVSNNHSRARVGGPAVRNRTRNPGPNGHRRRGPNSSRPRILRSTTAGTRRDGRRTETMGRGPRKTTSPGTPVGPAESLIFLDANEVWSAGPRKLQAAWAEVHNRKVLLPPTVCIELAWQAVPPNAVNGISQAEHRLIHETLDDKTKLELRKNAWWANVWRDDNSPYQAITLTPDQDKLKREIAAQIDPACFENAARHNVPAHRDTLIIAETLAVGGRLLLTSNMRSIKHKIVNEWATNNGARLGFKARPVVYPTDPTVFGYRVQDGFWPVKCDEG